MDKENLDLKDYIASLPKYPELDGKVVLVKGGTGDLGREIAKAFAAQCCEITLSSKRDQNYDTDKQLQELDEISKIVGGYEKTHNYISADITDEKQIHNLFDDIYTCYDTLDILVNSIGVLGSGLLADESEEQAKSVFEINYFGPRKTCKEFINRKTNEYTMTEDMVSAYARIINLSSIMSKFGNIGQASYSASKAALNIFTKSLAKEIQGKYKMRNFTANVIAPGIIKSKMADSVPQKITELCLKEVPMRRIGTPNEVASTALYIASNGAGYETGKIFSPDGGWY